MLSQLGSFAVVFFLATPLVSEACQLVPFNREPTIAEKVAGLDQLFAGTVVGYLTGDGG